MSLMGFWGTARLLSAGFAFVGLLLGCGDWALGLFDELCECMTRKKTVTMNAAAARARRELSILAGAAVPMQLAGALMLSDYDRRRSAGQELVRVSDLAEAKRGQDVTLCLYLLFFVTAQFRVAALPVSTRNSRPKL